MRSRVLFRFVPFLPRKGPRNGPIQNDFPHLSI